MGIGDIDMLRDSRLGLISRQLDTTCSLIKIIMSGPSKGQLLLFEDSRVSNLGQSANNEVRTG